MPRLPVRWIPDDGSAQILAAYTRRGERFPTILRRAPRLLAQADGILDPRGRVRQPGRPR